MSWVRPVAPSTAMSAGPLAPSITLAIAGQMSRHQYAPIAKVEKIPTPQ